MIQQAIEALRAGRPAESRILCKRHLRENPGDPDAMHLWGVTEYYSGRHEAAVRAFESAVAQRPDVAVFHNSLGVTYAKLGRYDDAAVALERAITLRPQSKQFHRNRESLGEIHNVGSSGAPFGVANNNDIAIMELMLATNDLTGSGSDLTCDGAQNSIDAGVVDDTLGG